MLIWCPIKKFILIINVKNSFQKKKKKLSNTTVMPLFKDDLMNRSVEKDSIYLK